ncbi:hypothetical protein JCM8202v2_005873 [Rhodotorula sphaerocarpa]
MLKRISNSFNKDGTAQNDLGLLIPPTPPFHQPGASPRSSPRGQHTPTQLSSFPFPAVPPSPLPRTPGPYPAGVPTSTTPSAAPSSRALDRPVLHKTLSSLSALLVALDELRDTSQAHSKARKRVAKATRDLAGGFSEKLAGPGGKGDEVAAALVSCAEMMEALQEVEEKHAKALKKEYEALNESIARYFRRTAKEEKAHEDELADLDSRVAKATASYHSSARSTSASSSQRNMHIALDSMTSQHAAYMQHMSSLSGQINLVKATYAQEIANRREAAARDFTRALCAMAEREWRGEVEAVKKGAGDIGRLISATVWIEAGMENVAVAVAGDRHREEEDDEPLARGGVAAPPPLNSTSESRQSRAPSSGTFETASSLPETPGPIGRAYASYTVSSSATGSTSRSGAHASYPSPGLSGLRESTSSATREDFAGDQPTESPRNRAFERRRPSSTGALPTPSGRDSFASSLSADKIKAAYQQQQTSSDRTSPPPSEPPMVHPGPERRVDQPVQPVSRQDSFVARMSRKYAETASIDQPPPDLHEAVPGPTRHARSDSRVSQLAKRYSAPPEGLAERWAATRAGPEATRASTAAIVVFGAQGFDVPRALGTE